MTLAKRSGFSKQAWLPCLLLLLLCLTSGLCASADTIKGTVEDPSGAVVRGAKVEISGSGLAQPLTLTTDSSGQFAAPNLSAGKYTVKVSENGFDDAVSLVELKGSAELNVKLTLATQQTSVNVVGKAAAFVNSDPIYRQLRDIGLGQTYHCE